MAGFDQWLSASALPVWIAGAAAALLFVAGVTAFSRARQAGRIGGVWRVALVLVGAGLMWVLVDRLGNRDEAAARRGVDARSAELTLRAITPGSPLACLEAVANATIEAACEKSLFSNPETIAAAVAYVDARLLLLADALEVAARDRGYAAALERQRSAIEADRFGIVAHVLSTRGCTADKCADLKLFRDPGRVAANLRERVFDASVVLNASAWRHEGAASTPVAAVPSGPALASAPQTVTTGSAPPPSGRIDYPSAASIPAISIMSTEPALPAGESNASPPSTSPPPAPKPPAPRRPPAQAAQQQQAQPPAPVPLPPPGTMSNPR